MRRRWSAATWSIISCSGRSGDGCRSRRRGDGEAREKQRRTGRLLPSPPGRVDGSGAPGNGPGRWACRAGPYWRGGPAKRGERSRSPASFGVPLFVTQRSCYGEVRMRISVILFKAPIAIHHADLECETNPFIRGIHNVGLPEACRAGVLCPARRAGLGRCAGAPLDQRSWREPRCAGAPVSSPECLTKRQLMDAGSPGLPET